MSGSNTTVYQVLKFTREISLRLSFSSKQINTSLTLIDYIRNRLQNEMFVPTTEFHVVTNRTGTNY